MASPAHAQESRFVLRNGQVVCGIVLGEQGMSMTVQTSNGLQVILRRDQIQRRSVEPCDQPAANPAAPAAAGQPAARAPAAPAAAGRPNATPAQGSAPSAAPDSPPMLRFLGSEPMADRLLPDLVDAFIDRLGLRPRGWSPGTAPEQRIQRTIGPAGQAGQAFSVTATVTGLAFPALAERRSDVALAARPPNAREIELVRGALGFDLSANEHVLALDGIAAVVHPDNPVRRVTMDQLRDMFTGVITNWSALGGPDRPIHLYSREAEVAAVQSFAADVLQRRPFAAATQRIPSWQDLSNAVADDLDGVAVLTMAYVGRGRALNLIASCGIEFEASEFGLRTQDYPLERRFLIYAGPNAPAPTDEFLQFALSSAAFEVVREAGYVPLQPTVGTRDYTQFRLLDATRAAPGAPDSRYMEAMGDYSVVVRSALRLSTTFRFELGSSQLDARGLRDIERVAGFLQSREGQRYRVNVLGFTDNVGAFGLNRSVSLRRANTVADMLRQRGVTVHQLRGFASVAPVACDDDPNAAVRNRRVEIWLTPS